MISGLTPNSLATLLGTNSAASRNPAALALEALAANRTASQAAPPSSPKAQELQSKQALAGGYGQLVAALNSFETALRGLAQPASVKGGVTAAAQQFVNAYNNLVSSLSSLTGPGGALAGDPLAAGLATALGKTEGAISSGAIGSLGAIGIAAKSDGTLSLTKSAVQAADAANPADTEALLGQAAQSLSKLAGQYGDPGRAIPAALDATVKQEQLLQMEAGAADTQGQAAQQQSASDYAAMIRTALLGQMTQDLTTQILGMTSSPQSGALPIGSLLSLRA